MNQGETYRPQLERLQRIALVVGVAGLLLCAVGALQSKQQFFESYLVGYLFWAGIAIGSFALLMLHHMFGAGWGFTIQRILEASTRTLPLLALLFLPVVLGMHSLYEWTHADVVAADALLKQKSAYLNVPFFVVRAVFYFAVWIGMSFLMNRWSGELDRTGDPRFAERLRNLSAPGLILYGLTSTFATVDWAMSLEPHWFSTIFGLIFVAGQILSAFALSILILRVLAKHPPMSEVIGPQQFHDVGNLTFAFTMIWAYLSISQYLIIWSGNLPETITWFQNRSRGGWEYVAVALIVLSFVVPFVLLLSRVIKRRVEILARVAVLILIMRLVDLCWYIEPSFHPGRMTLHWLDFVAPIGIGGIWLATFIHQLKKRPVLPLRDPRMEGAFTHAAQH